MALRREIWSKMKTLHVPVLSDSQHGFLPRVKLNLHFILEAYAFATYLALFQPKIETDT
jgi:hypothetical protein